MCERAASRSSVEGLEGRQSRVDIAHGTVGPDKRTDLAHGDKPAEPITSFEDASRQVTSYLKQAIPMGIWFVSRYDGDNQVYLTVADSVYGLQRGVSMTWSQTMCKHMLEHRTIRITPDLTANQDRKKLSAEERYVVNSYMGVPILHDNGQLFGSLCGLDPEPKEEGVRRHEPLLRLMSGLLGCVAELDLARNDLQRRLQAIRLDSETDELTGLTNRRGWQRLLNLEEERYRHLGEPGAIIYLDIDDLKIINDSSGHAAGDDHLCRAADVMKKAARSTDIVARLGGDEFSILMVGLTQQQVSDVSRRIQAALAAAGIHASIGHAAFASAPTFTEVCIAADKEMYAQKIQRKVGKPPTRPS